MTDQNRHYGAPLQERIETLLNHGRHHLVLVFCAAQMGDPDENTTWDLATAIAHRELHIALGWVSPGDAEQAGLVAP